MEFNKPNNKVEGKKWCCDCGHLISFPIPTNEAGNCVAGGTHHEESKWMDKPPFEPKPNNKVEEIVEEFDMRFGIDGPKKDSDSVGRSAGCDDCVGNIELRAEHRDFLRQALTSSYEQGVRDERERVRELLESKTGLSQNGDYYIKVQKALDSNELAGGIGDQTRTQIIWEAKDTLIDDLLQALKNN